MTTWTCLLATVVLGATPPTPAVTPEEVSAAVERLQAYLLEQQGDDGGWEREYAGSRFHAGGESALVTLALLTSGVSPQTPAMGDALRFLQTAQVNGTYAMSLRAHCWAAIHDEYLPRLHRDARWLVEAQRDGLFDYGPRRIERYDHSVTQFGVLGLWESVKRGGPAPAGLWHDVIRHFLETQLPDGGWNYDGRPNNRSTATMTAAGLTALLVAQQQAHRSRHRPVPAVAEAIERGLHRLALAEMSRDAPRRGRYWMYYLVSLERVALASGVKLIGTEDWFVSGARRILDREAGRGHLGHDLVDTAFALMFLSRGQVQVWINKLRVDHTSWNNRPNDVYFLTRHLSALREHELNWQVVNVEDDPMHWLNASVAYLASDEPIRLGVTAASNLRTYLDLGGVLLASADGNRPAFRESIRDLAAELYPEYDFRALDADHPLYNLVYHVEPDPNRPIYALSNGARELIVLAPDDWGIRFQAEGRTGDSDAHAVMANLYAMVNNRGRLKHRLDHPLEPRRDRPVEAEVAVVRAMYGGNWNPEPLAWEPLRRWLFNRTGVELALRDEPLRQIDRLDAPLVHLAGVEPVRFTDAELGAIHRYVRRGGTVLVETVGGRGRFSVEAERQLARLFGSLGSSIPTDSPVLSGGSDQASFAVRRVVYRPFSVLTLHAGHRPRLAVHRVGGRPAVLVSHEDLSLGAMGLTYWPVNGYDNATARRLLGNLLLMMRDRRPADSPADPLTDTLEPNRSIRLTSPVLPGIGAASR